MELYSLKNTRNVNRIVHHLLNMYLHEKFILSTCIYIIYLTCIYMKSLFSKQLLRILVFLRKSQKTYRTCTYERYLKFFVAIEV